MNRSVDQEVVPSSVREIIALFTTDLDGIRFPEVDAEILEELCETVESSNVSVAEAEEALAVAREDLEEKQMALLRRAQQALSYMRVYAEGKEGLAEILEKIALPKKPGKTPRAATSKAAPQGKRGRPSKNGPGKQGAGGRQSANGGSKDAAA